MSKRFLILALLAMQLGTAHAAEIRTISLQEAISAGLEKNHQIKAADHQTRAADAGAREASSHYYPNLFFEESVSVANVPTRTFMMKLDQGRFSQNDFQINNLNNPKSVTDFRSLFTWEQPLFVAAAAAERKVAARQAEQQRIAGTATREQVAFRIFVTCLAVQKAKAHLVSVEKTQAEVRESRRLAGIRLQAGLGLKSDELRADTQLAATEQQRISAANNLTLARLQLALLTGAASGEELDVTPLSVPSEAKDSAEQLAEKALSGHSSVLLAKASLEQADAARSAARSAYLPNLSGFASYQLNDHRNPFGAENDSWMAGLHLRWNLFDGFRRENRNEKAVATRSAGQEQLEQTRREVQYHLHAALLRDQEAKQRHTVAVSSVAAAEEAVRLVSRRFENALATMLELLDAQSALHQARALLVESETDRLLARGNLWYASGQFLQEVQKW